jgi:hypothetical protein
MAARKRISAPGRSGKTKRNSRSSRASGCAAHHVAHMLLGQFVVGQVDGGKAVALEAALDALGLVARWIARPTKTCATFRRRCGS